MPPTTPSSPIAALLPHLHSLAILSSYTLTFPSLLSTPSSTLLSTLPLLAALQTTFCLLCVSPLPSSSPSSAKSKRSTPKPSSTTPLSSRLLPTLLSLALTLTLGTLLTSFLLIVFGAPFTTHISVTIPAAAHIALLVGFPLVVRYGVDGERWRKVVGCEWRKIRDMGSRGEVRGEFEGAVGGLVGAWIGAVPIPLDWDREWQKWPVTVLTGAYVGYVVGKTVGGFLGSGQPAAKAKST